MIISFLLENTFMMLGYSFLEFEKKINLTLFCVYYYYYYYYAIQ
jgi:hypothetical protein